MKYLVLLVLILFSCSQESSTPPKYVNFYKMQARLDSLLIDKKYDHVLQLCDSLQEIFPRQEAYFIRVKGGTELTRGNTQVAKKLLSSAIKKDSTSIESYLFLTQSHALLDDFKSAHKAIDKALQLDSTYVDALFEKGKLLYFEKKQSRAIHFFSKAIAQNENVGNYYYYRALSFMEKGVTSKAIDDLSKVITLNPKDFDALFYRGLTYMDEARYVNAALDFKEAIAIDSSLIDGHLNMGFALLNAGIFSEARDAFNKVLSMEPENTYALLRRSETNFHLNKYEKAIEDLQLLLSIDENHIPALNQIAWTIYTTKKKEQYSKGIEYISKAIPLDPLPAYYDTRGRLYYEQGTTQAAIEDLNIFISQFTIQYGLPQVKEAIALVKKMGGTPAQSPLIK